MYKGLYNNFKHWFNEERGTVFFYSDPHFSDEEMNKARNITDREQIESINKVIGKYDTLVILGDIGNIECVRKLHGWPILVMGNHDAGAARYISPFREIYEGPLFISEKLLLSHEPIDCPYAINIHGHDHANRSYQDINHWNVCAENINYTPVPLKTILNSGRLKRIDSIHRVTIDKATERKKKK